MTHSHEFKWKAVKEKNKLQAWSLCKQQLLEYRISVKQKPSVFFIVLFLRKKIYVPSGEIFFFLRFKESEYTILMWCYLCYEQRYSSPDKTLSNCFFHYFYFYQYFLSAVSFTNETSSFTYILLKVFENEGRWKTMHPVLRPFEMLKSQPHVVFLICKIRQP